MFEILEYKNMNKIHDNITVFIKHNTLKRASEGGVNEQHYNMHE